MASDAQKTVAGALLAGAAILSGNAVLITAAGGVGVNWASEGLAGLWQGAARAFAPGTPVARAGERAIRRAVDGLRREYRDGYGKQAPAEAFDLVRDCAVAVAVAEVPAGGEPVAAQQALDDALEGLLHGHDTRAATLLRQRLLPAVAEAFRDELAADQEAWARYHGWLIEQIAARTAAQSAALAGLPEVFARLADPQLAHRALDDAADALEAQVAALQAAVERLAAAGEDGHQGTTFSNTDAEVGGSLLQAGGSIGGQAVGAGEPQPTRGGASFTNQGVKVKGNIKQAGGNIYDHSAHVQGGGFAVIINNPALAQPPAAGAGPAVRETLRQTYAQQIAALTEEYRAVSQQLITALGAGDRVRLKRQLDDLERQLTEAEAALRRLDADAAQ